MLLQKIADAYTERNYDGDSPREKNFINVAFRDGYETAIKQMNETLLNREKFIDWCIEYHLDMVKEYLGFQSE